MEVGTTKCAALGCQMAVSSDFLMCRRHWKMVPEQLQSEVWEAFHASDHAQHMTVAAMAREVVRIREIEVGRRCRSCSAQIFYAISTTTQKPMPIDAMPVDDGNIIVRQGKRSTNLYAKVIKKGEETAEERYKSHFATCAQANEWRQQELSLRS